MNIKEYYNFYHVDTAVQIDNNWNQDTTLGIVKDSRKYSILIHGKDKETIKQRFISKDKSDSAKKHNKKVIVITYSYLLFKALCDFSEANPILICRDVRPEGWIIQFLQRIANNYRNNQTMSRVIKFRKTSEFETDKELPESLAGKYVRKVYQGKIPPTKVINKQELDELINLINKLI